MNYPLWELPSPGLLIAFVAIVHVFVSHFAVGGGLFLVVAEMKARREDDRALLHYVRRHSRFFVLLTLVFGAVTGVGIWFTIGLIHPAATSSLINAFVWGWAIEWTFFFTEIAAAIVYYYGWDKLTPRQHVTVGWIYFGAAWGSLVVINGILAFMLTPGGWLGDREFWSGFFNPGYWPSLLLRTFGAIGLAGVYAIFTASWMRWPADEEASRTKLVRWAAYRWVVPMAVVLPLSLLWYLTTASRAGIPVAGILGTAGTRVRDLAAVAFTFTRPVTGQPITHAALRVALLALLAIGVLAIVTPMLKMRAAARTASVLLMAAAFAAVGGGEWAREGLRKPYVIGSYMFVNGLRLPPPAGSIAAMRATEDPLTLDHIATAGVLASANFVRASLPENPTVPDEVRAGGEVFRLLCSECHTKDGYLAIRPLMRGQSSAAIEGVIPRLATPVDAAGRPATWSTPGVKLASWRNRQMPPFAGTDDEKRALAVYLATIGGGAVTPRVAAVSGEAVFESACGMCHAPDGDWPMAPRVAGKSEADIFEMLGRLPKLNEAMPEFPGTDAERHALAKHLASMGASR
jgi:mono/diheme cytochrome c family protein